MAKNIRSEYIKKVLGESKSLEDKLHEVAQNTLKSILEEKTNKNLRQILSEDKDAFSEEEVEDDDFGADVTDGEDTDSDASTDNIDDESDTVADDLDAADDDDTSEEGTADEEGGDDDWSDLEQYKDEDGEYDLRGMDNDSVIKVLKVMGPEDGVRVVKNDNGTVTLEDDETEKEYILDLDGTIGGEDDDCEDGECEFEIEVDDLMEGKDDTGYTDNYQNKDVMGGGSDWNVNEPADPKKTYSMDGGVPKSTSKPWAGPKKPAPFNTKVNEMDECGNGNMFDDEDDDEFIGEAATSVAQNNPSSARGMTHHESVSDEQAKKSHLAYRKGARTTVSENVAKKAHAIFSENKQLKGILPKLQKQIKEAIVVNQSLGNIIKLITENTTSQTEKQDLVRRFNECRTLDESNALYESISAEFKRANKTQNNKLGLTPQVLSESRQNAVETPMYQSQDLSNTLSFMARLDAIQ